MDTASLHLHRLRAMVEPGQSHWDLSPKDVEAIRLAVDVLGLALAGAEHADDAEKSIGEIRRRLGLSVESWAVTLSLDD